MLGKGIKSQSRTNTFLWRASLVRLRIRPHPHTEGDRSYGALGAVQCIVYQREAADRLDRVIEPLEEKRPVTLV